ncbi:MAG: hypothetical protein DRQ48_09525 [Gammaproteobacteria bacterium]|nr:MAG: hypothetical protein DRQ48_09525 [Gammaproteobacteria bacterium]
MFIFNLGIRNIQLLKAVLEMLTTRIVAEKTQDVKITLDVKLTGDIVLSGKMERHLLRKHQ